MFETPPRKKLFEKYQKLNFEFSSCGGKIRLELWSSGRQSRLEVLGYEF